MKIFFTYYLALLVLILFSLSCKKNSLEPILDGTWEEINNTTDQVPTGCNLFISNANSEVSMCGINMAHPYNANTYFLSDKAKLNIKDGQIWYKERVMRVLWVVPVYKDIYFIDYDFDGIFLWIKGDNTSAKTTAKGVGQVFRKK